VQPTVGLLNVGSEDLKGNDAVRGAAARLRGGMTPIRFHGFIEGDDIAAGTVDVIVTDGFTGNVTLKAIEGVDLKPIGDDQTLVGMLRDGELDALFTARAPSSFLNGEPHIGRLFPDTRAAEQAYYKKTKLFPIMHLIGIRKTLAEKYPWLATSVYKAFCEAKALAMIDLRDVNALMVTLPWLEAETNATSAIMGDDFWKYGIAENMPDIEALTQYAYEQGLVDRKVKVEELFHPSTFEISKI